ncbi:hypothetical protein WDU94_009946 [Cyamophila willieti]
MQKKGHLKAQKSSGKVMADACRDVNRVSAAVSGTQQGVKSSPEISSANKLESPPTKHTYIDHVATKNVTALLGKTAYLVCKVRNLGNRTCIEYRVTCKIETQMMRLDEMLLLEFRRIIFHTQHLFGGGALALVSGRAYHLDETKSNMTLLLTFENRSWINGKRGRVEEEEEEVAEGEKEVEKEKEKEKYEEKMKEEEKEKEKEKEEVEVEVEVEWRGGGVEEEKEKE